MRCEAVAKHTMLKCKRKSWKEFTESLDGTATTGTVWKAIKSINCKQAFRNLQIG